MVKVQMGDQPVVTREIIDVDVVLTRLYRVLVVLGSERRPRKIVNQIRNGMYEIIPVFSSAHAPTAWIDV